ncbi:hypothetical protein KR222_003416, partial [Zaprionus bogoriensis]
QSVEYAKMAYKRIKTEDKEVNLKFACRCCLKCETEFLKLDALTDSVLDDNDASAAKIPLSRLLLFCMRTENLPELPQYICVECSKSLKISYFFIQNALRAHEILCRKLCPRKLKTATRPNGQQQQAFDQDDAAPSTSLRAKPQKSVVRHGCKICGAIIYNRLELKQHLRMHAEEPRHSCKLCNYVTLKAQQLPEHYRMIHGLTAIQIEQQLKKRRSLQAAAATASSASVKGADDGQVKVCTLEDMELLIPTVMTPEDFSHPQLDADQLRDIEQQLTNSLSAPSAPPEPPLATGGGGGNNMSIGAEFLVMPDGSLQQVNDGGVVFEYIDDSKTSSTTTNVTLQNLLSDSTKPNETCSSMDVDMNELVVQEAMPQITVKPKARPGPGSIAALRHKCKLCPKAFPTVARLKSHQLTHSHLPKFYCDQCAYYTLRSADLIQHYTEQHKGSISETGKSGLLERSPMSLDRSRIYSCDMCLFDTPSSVQLRIHYSDKHLIKPSEVQLRPSWPNESSRDNKYNSSSASNEPGSQAVIPLGIKYPPTSLAAAETTTTPVQLQPAQATTTAVVTLGGDINVVVDTTSLFYAAAVAATGAAAAATTTITEATSTLPTDAGAFAMFPNQSLLPPPAAAPAPAATTHNSSIFGDMQEFIDNTDVAAICTIPADDMPVVDGDDIVIDNNNISLDFAENLFEEFDEDVEVGEEDEEDEEDAENEDENDNNDAAADQNLLLTSDDDDVDDFDDEQSKHLQKPYCIFCNKKFTSQYKFENHMFVHRGLAPYRCELCTNLYNMKRLLIRHYKTVHKRMPTRDMVQAKGEKVSVERTTIEKIYVNSGKAAPMLMCAKCPYECDVEGEMRKHLNAHHGINDGVSVHANEVFIIRKLPYECPRCIRTFAAKHTLTRHLQRSHLVDTIIEMQAPQLTTSSAPTTTTMTATTTLPQNAGEGDVNNASESIDNSGGVCGDGDGDGEGDGEGEEKCATAENESMITTVADCTKTTPTTGDDSTTTEATTTEATTTTSVEKASVDSSLFPTPTPFDFDLDFMGDGVPHATTQKNNNDSFDVLPPQLLNGSDKLLSAALEPSPIKDLRSRLPRTPIFVCKQCNQTFDELQKLLQHELEQHSSGTLSPCSSYQHQCTICNTTYRTVTLLNYHMKRHATIKAECPKELAATPVLEKKTRSKHREKVLLRCDIGDCKKTFNFKHHLKRHQTASHTPVQYICPECGRDMMTSLHLRNHMTMHRGTHSYKCPKCVRTYMRR